MPSLAAVLIVKNEDKNLSECLSGLSWCDEIVVVDAGSEDNTVEIAHQYTNKVYSEPNWLGFGIQRQRAQGKTDADWIFMIDADERVTDELRENIKKVVAQNDQRFVYAVPRLSECFGKFIRYSGWYPDYVIRLYPRTKAAYGPQRVHEKLVYDESVKLKRLTGDLLHFTYNEIGQYLHKSAQYAEEWAIQRKQQGKSTSLVNGVLHGIACFVKMYIFYGGFLDGKHGLLLALLSAHSTFVKYADLWVRTQVE